MSGHANRGASAEAMVDAIHRGYTARGSALCLRLSPPMRITRRLPKGAFVAVFEARGMPDWLVVAGGVAILLDVKSTTDDRWPFADLPQHQAEAFGEHSAQGGRAGVLLSLGRRWWWLDWRELGPRWWAWHRTTGRAAPGTASLTVEQLGTFAPLRSADWLQAALEVA